MRFLTEEEFRHLINKQFEIAGIDKTFEDVQKEEYWFDKYTITPKQAEEYKKYVLNFVRKKLKWTKKPAERAVAWFILQYGLRKK